MERNPKEMKGMAKIRKGTGVQDVFLNFFVIIFVVLFALLLIKLA